MIPSEGYKIPEPDRKAAEADRKAAEANLKNLTVAAAASAASTKQVAEALSRMESPGVLKYLYKAVSLVQKMPDWAKQHILNTKALERQILLAESRGLTVEDSILKIFFQSKEQMDKIALKVDYKEFMKLLLSKSVLENYGYLLGPAVQLDKAQWTLNLGLLMNVYQRTKDESLKQQIRFLALQYLAKAAPIDFNTDFRELESSFKELFQFGAFTLDMIYHREFNLYDSLAREAVTKLYNARYCKHAFLTDTVECHHLFPPYFTTMGMDERNLSSGFHQIAAQHIKTNQDWQNKLIEPPILLDLTDLLKDKIVGSEKEKELDITIEQIETMVSKAVDLAVAQLKKDFPDKFKTEEDLQVLRVFLKANAHFICRAQIKGVPAIIPIGLFNDNVHFSLPKGVTKLLGLKVKENFEEAIRRDTMGSIATPIEAFLNRTGLRLGGVAAREKVFELLDLSTVLKKLLTQKEVQLPYYAIRGKNIEKFPRPDFRAQKLIRIAGKEELEVTPFGQFKQELAREDTNPLVSILGQANLARVEDLFRQITPKRWDELMSDPDRATLLQTTIVRLSNHLQDARYLINDPTVFSSFMELVDSEILTILTLTSPFDGDKEFQEIYTQRIIDSGIVPESLQGNITVTLTKSAMHLFSEVLATTKQHNPTAVCAHGEGCYFEEREMVPNSVEDILARPDHTPVDLYIGEFNHNVDISLTRTHYKPGDVIGDIEKLLKEGGEKQHLTVAIDCTIALMEDPKIGEVLNRFEKEIASGKLNFIFFRSGMKFDSLGMDSLYAGVAWMVNNGAKQWDAYKKCLEKDSIKTDSLSTQGFCLANRSAAEFYDEYRKQIFRNAKAFLSVVPPEYLPGGDENQQIRISTVDEAMDCSFIDIKILSKYPGFVATRLQKRLFALFAENGERIHKRASFGFFDPNVNQISTPKDEDGLPRNIRLNPGLNPNHVKLFKQFLAELPALLAEAEKEGIAYEARLAARRSPSPKAESEEGDRKIQLAEGEFPPPKPKSAEPSPRAESEEGDRKIQLAEGESPPPKPKSAEPSPRAESEEGDRKILLAEGESPPVSRSPKREPPEGEEEG